MTDYVLDASAVLAVIQDEPGAASIEAHLETGCISAVNLAEVVSKLQDRGLGDKEIDELLDLLDLDTRPLDSKGAALIGKLRRTTKAAGLSLGDRACLALAQSLGATALTMDRAWAELETDIRIEVAR